jgi:Rad3-related DNA helicase
VRALLEPGGPFSRRWPRYERRDSQRALAEDVANTVERGGILLAEAPTGVGKSLAYLLPSVLMAVEHGRRVVVATCTRSLQDQLVERDLPALLDALELRLPYARLKGKQNYLCGPGLDLIDARDRAETEELARFRPWADSDDEGDLDLYPATDPDAYRALRPRLATDPVGCSGTTCRRGRECAWVRARRRAADARLLVVNHALLALSGTAEGLLPEFDVLIVDEAHRLERVLLDQLERGISRNRFEDALRLIGSPRGARAAARRASDEPRSRGGLAARVLGFLTPLFDESTRPGPTGEVEAMVARVAQTRDDVERFFQKVEPAGAGHALYGVRERYRSATELMGPDLEPLETLHGHCRAFARGVRSLAAGVSGFTARGEDMRGAIETLVTDLEHATSVWEGLGTDLLALGEASERDWVHWRTSSSRGVELHGSPIDVRQHAHRLVLGRADAVVLTSATLSAGGDFRFVAGRLGLGDESGIRYEARSYPSPFPLERQMHVYVTNGGDDEASAIAEVVSAIARQAGRNQLVLFTAHERLRRTRERLLRMLPDKSALLAQEWDGPATLVSDRFRAGRGAILLGVQSLWEGVDFPGEALEILVVTRLPFSVPDDPLVQARAERLQEQGRDPFREDSVPEAVLRFRQGVGRLIRRADDRGVLVVCDPRLRTASYRKPFLAALPVEPEAVADAEALARTVAEFFGEPGVIRSETVEAVVEEERA